MSTNAAAPRLVRRRRRRPGGNKLTMRRGVPLRDAVLGGFSRIVAHARAAARRASADPIESVHDFRKSVRRARAVVALLRPSLGRTAAGGVTHELRRAFGPTGALRDTHIRADTLRNFPSDDPARDAILRALEEEAGGESAPAGKLLDAGSRILQPLPRVLEVTLPRAYAMDDLARGVARGWRRTRRALKRAAATGLDADFHEWRKRVKELRYQVELLASTGSAELKRREKALADLAQELGRVTDLIVLRSALLSRQELGTLPAAASLMEEIRLAIGERSRELLARGPEVFAEPPAEFARRVLAERG